MPVSHGIGLNSRQELPRPVPAEAGTKQETLYGPRRRPGTAENAIGKKCRATTHWVCSAGGRVVAQRGFASAWGRRSVFFVVCLATLAKNRRSVQTNKDLVTGIPAR